MNVFFPLWGKVAVVGIVSVFAMVSLPLAVGVCSFFPVYAYRHQAAHSGSTSAYAKHHLHHHFNNSRVNHGGIYPIYDKIFGTFEPHSD
jgi:sterol desaturase/sphingolipid hydroxylase (fatty acid hydroxylase superfamily)